MRAPAQKEFLVKQRSTASGGFVKLPNPRKCVGGAQSIVLPHLQPWTSAGLTNWSWGITYGSILGMNIHLPPIWMFTRGTTPQNEVRVRSQLGSSCPQGTAGAMGNDASTGKASTAFSATKRRRPERPNLKSTERERECERARERERGRESERDSTEHACLFGCIGFAHVECLFFPNYTDMGNVSKLPPPSRWDYVSWTLQAFDADQKAALRHRP